jgi:glycosyltransferase involved in cell wall biosynthesis
MASGVPTVAFDYGAAREHLCDDCGRRVAFRDDAAFIVAAVELARDDTARHPMRTTARNAVEKLDPLSVCANFADLLGGLNASSAA